MKLSPWEPDLSTLVNRINADEIDLQPDFQRKEVWSRSKQKRLIDTILRGWSIPPVHLVVMPNGQFEVLDGQQRLVAIRDFYSNKFSIDGKLPPYDPFVAEHDRKFYSRLDSDTRRAIDNYTLRCFRISDFKPDEPSELFYRLNQPTALTAGEQRNALYGPAREQLKDLVSFFEGFGNSVSSLGFSNLRLAYDDVLARLLYLLEVGNILEKTTESRISDRFRQDKGFSERVVGRAMSSIEIFSESRLMGEYGRLNKASLLSWLIFNSRFAEDTFYDMAFHAKWFEAQLADDQRGESAIAMFADRASLRVTDVSSVVYRDFCLCYMYMQLSTGELPESVDRSRLKLVHKLVSEEDVTFSEIVEANVDVADWGSQL